MEKFKIEVEYFDEAKLTGVELWEAESKEDIFKKFDKKNNSLRYCNGSYYKFKDKNHQKEYMSWYRSLDEATKFKMFYGNGIVD